MLRRIFILIAAIGVILAGLLFIVPLVLPADTVKTQIEKLIAENTGWKIRFGGDVSMSLLPSVRLVAQDIEVSPPNHKPILKAQEARFAVGLKALFSGAVDIEEVYFDRPDLTVELGKNGNPVWLPEEDGTSAPAASAPAPQANEPTTDEPGAAGNVVRTLVDTLRVERLAIDNANITVGTIGEAPTELKNINFAAFLPDPQGALNVEGSAVFNGDKITLKGEVPAFKNLINTNKGSISVEAGYKTAKLLTNGAFDLDADTVFDGTVDVNVADISQIAGSDTLVPGVVKAKGTLLASKERITLDLEQGQLIDTTFATKILAQIGGARPLITGSIDLGDLNLDTLQPATSSAPSPSSDTSKGAANTSPDLSGLGAVDADISFSAASIQSGAHRIDNLKGGVILNDGVGELTIDEIVAVGGSASARLTADTKASPLTTYGTLKANNLSIPTILALAGQDGLVNQLKGLLNTDLVFGFQGLTPQDITNTVNARGTIGVSKASMSGLGLASSFNNDPSADRLDAVSLVATIDGFTKPVSVNGQARFRGEVISLDATSDPAALIAGQKAKTRATVSFSKASATFDGDVSPAIPAAGTISLKGNSLRALAKWFGSELPPGPGYGRFDIKTGFAASETKVSLSDLSLALDDIKGTGNASVLLNEKPDITANISFDLLDINPYIATPSTGNGTAAAPSNASAAWSREPIDFSFINAANVNLTARVGTLKAEGLSVGPLALKTTMRGGKLSADLTEMGFYGGQASAKIVVDAGNQTPSLAAQLTSQNVQAYPFLRDAAKFERIEGGLNYALDVTTAGRSQAAMVAALNGTTSFNFNNGAIRGINIAKAMRSLTGGALNGWNNSASEKTDFSAFTASFDIVNGLATNSDLNLVGPLVRVSGSGTVQMPQQTLKYRVDPKVVASLQGQGGSKDLAGFGVPIIIEGPWAKPKIYPDIKGFLQDPAAGLAALKSLGGGFDKIASGKTGDILNTLGNDPKGAVVAKAADKIKEEIGIDVSGLLKDGKISKEGGAGAVVGALSGLLGGGGGKNQAAPLQVGEIPIPRTRPNAPTNRASSAADIVKRAIAPSDDKQNTTRNLPAAVPKEAEEVLKGLGGLFGR